MSANQRLTSLKERAKYGDDEALRALGKMGSTNIRHFMKIIPTLMHHLPVPIPDLSSMQPTQAHPHVLAKSALVSLAAGFGLDGFASQDVVLVLKRHWSQIWTWVVYLHNRYIYPESKLYVSTDSLNDDTGDIRDRFHHCISRLLLCCTLSESPFALMTSSQDYFQVVASLLVSSILIPACHSSEDDIHMEILGDSLELATRTRTRDEEHWRGIRDAFNHIPTCFAPGILNRFISMISRDSNPMLAHQYTRAFLRCTRNMPLFNMAFIQRRSISWNCRMIKSVGRYLEDFKRRQTRPLERADAESKLVAVYADCLCYLHQTIEQHGSFTVVQSLKGGLLKCLVRWADLMEKYARAINLFGSTDTARNHFEFLLKDIIKYTTHHSVCAVLSRALRESEEVYAAGTVLDTEYSEFREKIHERLSIWRQWNQLGQNYCANAECPLSLTTRSGNAKRLPLFRCSGCGLALYCSKSCQQQSWNTDHRDKCRTIRKNRFDEDGWPKANYFFDSRDSLYRDWFILEHIDKYRITFLSKQRQFRSRHPSILVNEPVVSVLDFATFPLGDPPWSFCNINTQTVPKTREQVPDADWDVLLDKAKKRNGKDPLVMAIIPVAGDYHHYYWIGFGRQ